MQTLSTTLSHCVEYLVQLRGWGSKCCSRRFVERARDIDLVERRRSSYDRLYYRQNKDKLNEQHRQFCTRNKDSRKEYHRQFRAQNKDKMKEASRLYVIRHRIGEPSPARRSWKTPELVRDYFETVAKKLQILEYSDWYRISDFQIRNLGGAHSSLFVLNFRTQIICQVWRFRTSLAICLP